jgi:hypothetical protein
MTLTSPPHTDSWPPSERSEKIECSDVLRCRFVVRHHTEFLKNIQKAYFKAVLDIFKIFSYDHPEPR